MKDLPENVQIAIVLVSGVVSAAVLITLAISYPTLFAAIVLTLSLLVVGIFLFERFQPLSEFRAIRKSHPGAKDVIDQAEKEMAGIISDVKTRRVTTDSELGLLIEQLQKGRDALVQIQEMQRTAQFQEDSALDDGYRVMIDTTIANTVAAFLELSTNEVKDYVNLRRSSPK